MTTQWRSIADQLTGAQIAELEKFEAAGDTPFTLLFCARDYAAMNLELLLDS